MKKELLLAAMGISSLTPGCVPTGTEDPTPADPQPTGQVASKKIDVDRLLKRVAEQPVPESLNPGAMCYAMMAPPDRAEYVCPTCGTKTIHALNQLTGGWDAPALSIKSYRTYIEQLNKLGLVSKLDESYLCSACKKEGVSGLFLDVTVKGRVIRTALQGDEDLRKLIAFVQGDLVWKGDRGCEIPLKPALPRIKQLLGVKE
jgi:DNA-directed RNA polymerase subunit RPC12/RpoP